MMNLGSAPGVLCSPWRRPRPPRIWRAPAGAFSWATLLLQMEEEDEKEMLLPLRFPAEALSAFVSAERRL